MFRRFFLIGCLIFLQNYSYVSFAEDEELNEDISEEEWAIIENWEMLENLDVLKENLEDLKDVGEDNEKD